MFGMSGGDIERHPGWIIQRVGICITVRIFNRGEGAPDQKWYLAFMQAVAEPASATRDIAPRRAA
jgi:hypothetical protein